MSIERETAIRELMRAASNALAVCGNEALDVDPRLASKILMFGTAQEGARARIVVDLAAAEPKIAGEMVRDINIATGEMERLTIFELLAAPPDVTEGLH
jgi:hypothetical protein